MRLQKKLVQDRIESKRIRLDGTSENPIINFKKTYLAHTIFGWSLGKFHREWFGLTLASPCDVVVSHQLNDIDDLYEVVLPKIRRQPTQNSMVTAKRKKEGACLNCGSKEHKDPYPREEDEY